MNHSKVSPIRAAPSLDNTVVPNPYTKANLWRVTVVMLHHLMSENAKVPLQVISLAKDFDYSLIPSKGKLRSKTNKQKQKSVLQSRRILDLLALPSRVINETENPTQQFFGSGCCAGENTIFTDQVLGVGGVSYVIATSNPSSAVKIQVTSKQPQIG